MSNKVNEYLNNVYPNNHKLVLDENGTVTTIIIDEELDGFKCMFNYDECVEIHTEGYTHITLSKNNLLTLMNMIDEAENYYKEYYKNNKE